VNRYFLKTLASQIRHGKTLYLLTVLGVALGVASVICIQVLNLSALAAFDGSVKAISGEADLSVVGSTSTLDEAFLPQVLADRDVAAAWPVYRVDVAVSGYPDLYLEVVGFDFFAPVRFPLVDIGALADAESAGFVDDGRGAGAGTSTGTANRDTGRLVAAALGERGWVALTPAFAGEMGWTVGDTFRVSSGSRSVLLTVGALVDFGQVTPLATRKIALMDIAQTQALLGRSGRIHQIDLKVVGGAAVAMVAERLAERLGPTTRVLTPEQREQDAAGLLAAFRLNLTALSLVSVFVGIFLIFSAIQASLVRRRSEFGLLRSLGASRWQVRVLIFAEAALLGALGVAIGVPVGRWAALANVDVVSATLTNLYLLAEIERLTFPPLLWLLAVTVGVGGAVLGALLPVLDISRRGSHDLLTTFTLHERAWRYAPHLATVAAAVTVSGLVWFASWGHTLKISGFVLGFLLLVTLPLVSPLLIKTLCGWVRPHSFGLSLGMRNLAIRLQTTSFAVGGLAVTVTMLVGTTLLIGSFRETLIDWLDVTMRADVYVSTESWVRADSEAFLSRQIIDELSVWPGVRAVEGQRRLRVRTTQRELYLSGLNLADAGVPWETRLPLLAGDPVTTMRGMRGGGVVISEPLARKERLAVGDTLTLYGRDGPFGLPIVGVVYDYTSESGTAFVDLPLMERHFGPGPTNNIALFLEPRYDPAAVVDQLKTHYGGTPLVFRSNRKLRSDILAIFDQTFAVTYILQAMALLIAVIGISLTLLILARERAAELALYRALGAARRQVFGLLLGEGLSLAVLGMALGLLGGSGLAALLILVINRAYFGWTIQPSVPSEALLRQVAVILAAAVLASLYPAWRSSLASAQELSREDV